MFAILMLGIGAPAPSELEMEKAKAAVAVAVALAKLNEEPPPGWEQVSINGGPWLLRPIPATTAPGVTAASLGGCGCTASANCGASFCKSRGGTGCPTSCPVKGAGQAAPVQAVPLQTYTLPGTTSGGCAGGNCGIPSSSGRRGIFR